MPIDTSMYQNMLRPPKSVAELDAEAMQGQQNRLALQLEQGKATEFQRNIAGENKLSQLLAAGGDPAAVTNGLASAGYGSKALAYTKTQQDLAKGAADVGHLDAQTGKLKQETTVLDYDQREKKRHKAITDIAAFTTPQEAMASLKAHADAGDIAPEQAQMIAQGIPQNPADFPKWQIGMLQRIMSAKDVMGQIAPDANAKLTAQTSTDNNAATNATSRDNNAATVGATVQGHKLTAGTAAARLAFDKEQAVGSGPDASEAMIDAIGQGKMAPPTGYALRNPKILQMMERVAQKYPEYDATEYAGKTRAMRDFTTGKQGDSIRSFAVASDHLTQLGGLVDALENKDIPLVNKYGNIIAQQTGSVAPTNFDAAKGIVAKEVLKSIVAGGGGVDERQELAHLLDNAKTGPQLKGVINTYLHLMEAQREGLTRQYEISTGRKDAKTRFDYSKKAGAAAKPSLNDIFKTP